MSRPRAFTNGSCPLGSAGLLLLLGGCGAAPEDELESATANLSVGGPCDGHRWGADGDLDSIDDGVEACVLQTHAPVMRMPFSRDWTRPGNVDWYLARSTLRFNHDNTCDDCEIVPRAPDQWTLAHQRHQKKNGLASWSPCGHNSSWVDIKSDRFDASHHFFLQMLDHNDRPGPANSSLWIVYGHVYPNDIGGVNAQYWFFYPYNDGIGPQNHEGDWEMLTVRRRRDGVADGAFVCAHGDCPWRSAAELQWAWNTHPIVWVADGSHASYATIEECDSKERRPEFGDFEDSCETNPSYQWITWKDGNWYPGIQGGGIINVGERTRPLGGHHAMLANLKWGEIGAFDGTSGPITPTFKTTWWIGGRR